MDFKSIFTKGPSQGADGECAAAGTASKLFDQQAVKIERNMRLEGSTPDEIKAQIATQKAEYVANVCKKPGGMKP